MIRYAWKRFLRAPLSAICAFTFACIVSLILCALHDSLDSEIHHYEETYHTIPVELSVTNLTATKSTKLNAPAWVADVFIYDVALNYMEYVKDVKIQAHLSISAIDLNSVDTELIGITSIEQAYSLDSDYGGSITWMGDYDQNIFSEDEMLCVVPKGLVEVADGNSSSTYTDDMPLSHITLWFSRDGSITSSDSPSKEIAIEMTIAGIYEGDSSEPIYCSYLSIRLIYENLGKEINIDSVSAILRDNDQLGIMKNIRHHWFAEPSATGAKVEWDRNGYTYYPYALDINDSLLLDATATLQNSILVNSICRFLVFLLSSAAGLIIGFLLVRLRKVEIALMRTLGTNNWGVYLGFASEQAICLVAGTIMGGAVFCWNSTKQLAIFISCYFVSLSVALIFFLHSNLISVIKEAE